MSVSDDVEVSMILKFKVSRDLFYVNILFRVLKEIVINQFFFFDNSKFVVLSIYLNYRECFKTLALVKN